MGGNKDIKSIVPVMDKFLNNSSVSRTGHFVLNKKNMDKFTIQLDMEYNRITGNNINYAGWKCDVPIKKMRNSHNSHSSHSSHKSHNPRRKSSIVLKKSTNKITFLTRSHSTSSIPELLKKKKSCIENIKLCIPSNSTGTGTSTSTSMSTSTSTRPSTPELRFIKKEKIIIDMEINGLKDLIKLINENPLIENVEYNIDIETLHKIKKPLNELNNMIGMKLLKDNIIDQVIYYIQEFHKLGKCEGDFMHTVIYGPPGTGKTEVAKIIGRIFSKLGILNKGTFRKVTRSDLIAGYLGQTAIKTKEVINECLGGVLFIDEAYALGNSEKKDSFSKECIDTLCEALSDHKDNIMVIIAGYEKELKTCFFNYNDGLESRFTWRFKTDEYTGEELKEIFLKKVKEAGWKLAENTDIKDEWFKNNKDYFKYYGRDMETLFAKTKICHSRRVFLKSKEHKTKITMEDIENGFKLYLENGEVKSRKDNTWSSVKHMYN
jgi:ATP-dependent 26S proteasome regulatory subunit